MRYVCFFCYKSVTSEVPDHTVIRAVLICPECLADRRVVIPDDRDGTTVDDDADPNAE